MTPLPFEPRLYAHRDYIRGVDFTVHALTGILSPMPGPIGAVDLRFPRFTTRTGQFERLETPRDARKAPAILRATMPEGPVTFAYREAETQAPHDTHDPEAAFDGQETIADSSAQIDGVSGGDLFSAAIFITKRMHQRLVEAEGKWIYTRLRAESGQALLSRLYAADPIRVEVRLVAQREAASSVSTLLLDGETAAEIFFARLTA